MPFQKPVSHNAPPNLFNEARRIMGLPLHQAEEIRRRSQKEINGQMDEEIRRKSWCRPGLPKD
jgi:hypothetical protein